MRIIMGHWIRANIYNDFWHISDPYIMAEQLYSHKRGLDTSQRDAWKHSQLSELQSPGTKPSPCLKTPWNTASSVKPSLMKWKWEPDVLQLHYKDNHIYSTT